MEVCFSAEVSSLRAARMWGPQTTSCHYLPLVANNNGHRDQQPAPSLTRLRRRLRLRPCLEMNDKLGAVNLEEWQNISLWTAKIWTLSRTLSEQSLSTVREKENRKLE